MKSKKKLAKKAAKKPKVKEIIIDLTKMPNAQLLADKIRQRFGGIPNDAPMHFNCRSHMSPSHMVIGVAGENIKKGDLVTLQDGMLFKAGSDAEMAASMRKDVDDSRKRDLLNILRMAFDELRHLKETNKHQSLRLSGFDDALMLAGHKKAEPKSFADSCQQEDTLGRIKKTIEEMEG